MQHQSFERGSFQGEQGYALQIAIITFLVLIIGVAAMLGRTSSGYLGAFLQGTNREARDAAESAIAEFGNTMNREENRYILVAGNDATWSDEKNPCTQYNTSGTKISVNPTAISSATITRFYPSSSYQNLISGDSSRQFKVESVEYKKNDRTSFSATSDASFKSDIHKGGERTLIRVTVIGKITRNGKESYARVAREFEVVPKCCKRSFGKNLYGAKNWGRDSGECTALSTDGSGNGIIASMNGGSVSGSSNQLDIRDESNKLISQSLCWSGNDTAKASDLTGTANATCTAGTMKIGNSNNSSNSGLSFVPTKFSLQLPKYAASGSSQASNAGLTLTINASSPNYLYYDTSSSTARLCTLSAGKVNCSGSKQTTISGSCYTVSVANTSATPGRPKAEVNCRFNSINIGNNQLYIDTSAAKFNFFFDQSTSASEYMANGGSGDYIRVDCSANASSASVTSSYGTTACQTAITWSKFQEKCTLNTVSCPDYDSSELLNVYATGNKEIQLNGSSKAVGINIYAPYASVTMKGGGNEHPNFMGRVWANALTINGNVKIRTPSSNASFCSTLSCPPNSGVPYFDFVARSFSQSSGF